MQQEPEITTCPRCGLVLRVETRTEDLTFFYDVDEWRQRCNDPDLALLWQICFRSRTAERSTAVRASLQRSSD